MKMLQNPHVLLTFDKVHQPLRLPRETTSEPPKMVRTWCVLYILTWRCASRHNGVHFFDISTSKNGPKLVCFVHFDFEMCFAPQRRAIFNLSSASLLFDPPEPQIIGKTPCFAILFAHLHLLSSDSFSSTLLSSNLSLLPDPFHLCFSSVNIVGSLTSKLPSIIFKWVNHYSYVHIYIHKCIICQ